MISGRIWRQGHVAHVSTCPATSLPDLFRAGGTLINTGVKVVAEPWAGRHTPADRTENAFWREGEGEVNVGRVGGFVPIGTLATVTAVVTHSRVLSRIS
ncbi:hypothetical protein GW17_00033116 [Ensete ventricosum]|nr:hypothetical protein GW17_00033116 [Ensete ventricosum]